ncbi:extracellular solute-binding protein [Schaalia suimastitidis]|uniref:extracellular solute-binding protein n=1 Tax=Schaalia suimastitidis TaxID=121163 RepID=UPI0003FADA3F|nr:extracellular solute-binding protein [Schaalia suimastitidis]
MSTRATKVAALGAVAAMAIGLAACNNTATQTATETTTDVVEITYVHRLPDGDGAVKVQEIADRWNAEHPNIHVTATKWDGKASELAKKLEADVKAGTAPCLAQLGYAEVPEAFVKGLVEDVTTEAEKYKDNYSGAYGQMSVGGVVVGLPQDTGPLVYYYDKAEFDALGLKVPTTLAELKEEATKAAAQGKHILAFETDESSHFLAAQAAAVGDPWYSAEGDQWKVNVQNEGAEVVSAFWQEMIDSGAALVTERWTESYDQALKDKKLIGNIGAAWEAGFFLDSIIPEDQEGTWQVALLPDFGEGVKTGPDGGSGVAVMKGCAHVAEAMEFNNWFNTQTADLATQGLVVAAKGDVVTPEKTKRQFGGQDVFAVLADANQTLNPDFGFIPGFSAVAEKMVAVGGEVGQGNAKVADIFAAAQTESVSVLKSLNLPVAE